MSVRYKGKEFRVKKNKLNLKGKNIESIYQIEGLSELTNLEVLNLAKNNIIEIQGLETLKNLKTLSLTNNRIETIKGLQNLTNLEELWLDKNKILIIDGLDMLKNLRRLSLRQNLIEEIEGLDNLTNLTYLSIDSNPFHEIKGLGALANLTTLYFGFIETVSGFAAKIGNKKIPKDMGKIIGVEPGMGSLPRVNIKKLIEHCQHKKEKRLDSPHANYYDFRFNVNSE